MDFIWLKQYMPRSLIGRAMAIMLLPIILLQLIVGAVFIQRHFDGVTAQLATGVALEIETLIALVETDGGITPRTHQTAEGMRLTLALDPQGRIQNTFKRRWFDVSGRTIRQIIQDQLNREIDIDLARTTREVDLRVPTDEGLLMITAPRKRLSAANPHQLLVIMITSSLILTYISYLFLRNQVKPITRLARAAEAFGKGRSDEYKPSGADEVRSAGIEFLSMRQRIERHLEQRTLMLSGVSHDLRTPLTRMKLALATVDESTDLDALSQDIVEMEEMLDGFLAFARDTSVEKTALTDPVDLARKIVQNTPQSDGKLSLNVAQMHDGETRVNLRPIAARRAVQNLVNNALKYGDQVRLSVRLGTRAVSFSVEDNGPGIDASERERAVRPFTRLDPSRNQDAGAGSGLGLAIALDVARTHGGTLSLDEGSDLGGLKATISFPR
jgi:two-component system osmolarity sensor histidine kinase EnvZ